MPFSTAVPAPWRANAQTVGGCRSPLRTIQIRSPGAYRDGVSPRRVVSEHGFDASIVAVAVLSEIELLFGEVPGPRWLLVPGVLLYTLPLLLRRRFPFIAPAFVFGVHIAITFADPQAVGSLDTGPIALLLTFWAVGERNDGQLAVAGLGLGLGTIAIVTVVDVRVGVEQAVNGALLGSLAWLFALLLARRGRRAAAAEARAVQLERDHEQRPMPPPPPSAADRGSCTT